MQQITSRDESFKQKIRTKKLFAKLISKYERKYRQRFEENDIILKRNKIKRCVTLSEYLSFEGDETTLYKSRRME